MLCLWTEIWCFSVWVNVDEFFENELLPYSVWLELDGKMGHVGERTNEKPLTLSPVSRSCFPMAHKSLPPDLIETP